MDGVQEQATQVRRNDSPDDEVLGEHLEARLRMSMDAVQHHARELERHERISEACRRGLDALHQAKAMPPPTSSDVRL